MPRTIAHVDMDAFYAAVEQRDQPALRGKPVIVGGPPQARGVVSAASYEARQFGVRSAMPTREAFRLCPHGVFLPVRMERYAEVSQQVMTILGDFTPAVEQISVDEAFLDLTGTERLLGPAAPVCAAIQQRIRDELQLTASVGLAPNKFLAKIASDLRKPDALVVVPPEGIAEFLAPLPIAKLWGVGPATERKLRKLGLATVGQLQRYDAATLRAKFGRVGAQLHELAQGHDDRPVVTDSTMKSISHETTFAVDVADAYALESVLLELTEQVAWRLRRHHWRARTVTLKLRFASFTTITRSRTLAAPSDLDSDVYDVARSLFRKVKLAERVRLLGVGVSQLVAAGAEQLTLFEAQDKPHRAARAADAIRAKFGPRALTKARLVREPGQHLAGNLADRAELRERGVKDAN